MKNSWISFYALGLVIGLSACIPKQSLLGMGDPQYGVEITWHGHSCFTLEDSLGRKVVIDPFDETVGYGRLALRADALLVTHRHFDHRHTTAVKSRRINIDLVKSTGTVTVAGALVVTGVESDHDDAGGEIHGPNTMYVFKMGGLKIVHLGDLGQKKLTPYQISFIGSADVLFIPVGGFVTIDPKEAKKIIEVLKPKLVFPMHYGNIRFYKLAKVSEFTKLFSKDQVVNLEESQYRARRAELPQKPKIITLVPTPTNF